jgi:hypothetical protein
MQNTRFQQPIYVNRKHFIEELNDLESVLDFLEGWPESKRDLAFDTLQRVCLDAHHGRFPLEAAAENCRRFLRRLGVLLTVGDIPATSKTVTRPNIGDV